ncbi:MAG TPA: hypothetical protein VJP77_03795 [Planctomycetota bacterium]|nr:hypothetical protein [Planctomycetota bacterium]
MRKIIDGLARFAALEPVVIRSLIGSLVTIAAVWGVDLADIGGAVGTTLEQAIIGAGLILVVVGIRDHVTPTAAVLARVDDPRKAPAEVDYLVGGYPDAPTGARIVASTSLSGLAARETARW